MWLKVIFFLCLFIFQSQFVIGQHQEVVLMVNDHYVNEEELSPIQKKMLNEAKAKAKKNNAVLKEYGAWADTSGNWMYLSSQQDPDDKNESHVFVHERSSDEAIRDYVKAKGVPKRMTYSAETSLIFSPIVPIRLPTKEQIQAIEHTLKVGEQYVLTGVVSYRRSENKINEIYIRIVKKVGGGLNEESLYRRYMFNVNDRILGVDEVSKEQFESRILFGKNQQQPRTSSQAVTHVQKQTSKPNIVAKLERDGQEGIKKRIALQEDDSKEKTSEDEGFNKRSIVKVLKQMQDGIFDWLKGRE